jgi:hypothetical protein
MAQPVPVIHLIGPRMPTTPNYMTLRLAGII